MSSSPSSPTSDDLPSSPSQMIYRQHRNSHRLSSTSTSSLSGGGDDFEDDDMDYQEFLKRLEKNSHVDISEIFRHVSLEEQQQQQQQQQQQKQSSSFEDDDVNNRRDRSNSNAAINIQKEIDILLGPKKTWSTESDEVKLFRDEMKMIRGKEEDADQHSTSSSSSSSSSSTQQQQQQQNLKRQSFPPIYLSNDPLPTNLDGKKLVCKVNLVTKGISKTVKCDPCTTADDFAASFIKTINAHYSDDKKAEEWVFKAAGSSEYMYGDVPMIQFEAIRKYLKKGGVVKLNLMNREEVSKEMDPQDVALKTISYDIHSERSVLSTPRASYTKYLWEMNEPFRVKVSSLYYYNVTSKDILKEPTAYCLYTTAQIFHGAIALTGVRFTKALPFSKTALWEEVIIFPDLYFSELPREAKICFNCYARPMDKRDRMLTSGENGSISQKDIPIGYINARLFDHRGCLNTNKIHYKMWPDKTSDPLSTCLENAGSEVAPLLFIAYEPHGATVAFPPVTEKPSPFFDSRLLVYENQKSCVFTKQYNDASLEKELNRIIHIDPLSDLKGEERYLVWKNRERLVSNPHALAKFMESVPWQHPTAVYTAHQMLDRWAPIDPVDSLQLLNYKFADSVLRKYVIKVLDKLPDHELADFLLQLVQTLKYELYHDSSLARFLLQRGLRCSNIIGHILYWHLKAEMHSPPIRERHGLILEEYLHHCGSHRIELLKQSAITDQLLDIALAVKKSKKIDNQFLRDQLRKMTLPPKFKIPLSPKIELRGIDYDKCKIMSSKKLPLWLVFENNDPTGDQIYVIFKSGDDLRQDLLTLQMLKIMDTMWKKDGVDLHMQPYGCVAIGDMTGMIEVVMNSDTIANITNARGGASAALFSQDPLAIWLAMHNQSQEAWDLCVDNFVRSCAGYCCATYVLGIGDRHNDNIMLTKKGGLFHIDFGHFLGNYKSKLGIKRETTPFVFTPMYAYVMGGAPDGDNFKIFADLSCKAFQTLRNHGHVLMNLFLLMMATGIPELTCVEDVMWLRNCLVLDKTADEANHHFRKLIQKSLKNTRTKIGDAVHILVHK